MCALHDGQIVDVAAPLTSCFRWQSKHSTTLLRLLFHKPSNRCIREAAAEGASVRISDRARVVTIGERRGAAGAKCEPHCRHIVLLAAAYSCCLKPQCGHSTLTLTGDDFATVSLKRAQFMPALRTLPSLPAPRDESGPDVSASPWPPGSCRPAKCHW